MLVLVHEQMHMPRAQPLILLSTTCFTVTGNLAVMCHRSLRSAGAHRRRNACRAHGMHPLS